jgi:uncharacterized linocin/CFP29 family protein
MQSYVAEVCWTDEQWSRVNKTIQAEAQKARVAAQFLPMVQEPDASAVAVRDLLLGFHLNAPQPPTTRLTVDSTPQTFLTSFGVNVALTSQEMNDPTQSAALVQFRRAANIIARLEDALIFRGQTGPGVAPPGLRQLPPVFDVGNGGAQPGLASGPIPNNPPRPWYPRQDVAVLPPVVPPQGNMPAGHQLASAIIQSIGELEAAGHNRPFACVLSQDQFDSLHTPTADLVLPRDRVVPFLEGPLLRSSTIAEHLGIVVALGGSPIEIVVSSELHAKFLQVTTEPRYVFRVSERIALRVTDWSAIVVLHPPHP